MTVFNDGDDPVHIYVNDYAMEATYNLDQTPTDPPLVTGDDFHIDMRASKIKKVRLVCDAGNSASVRIFAAMKEYRAKQREEVKI